MLSGSGNTVRVFMSTVDGVLSVHSSFDVLPSVSRRASDVLGEGKNHE